MGKTIKEPFRIASIQLCGNASFTANQWRQAFRALVVGIGQEKPEILIRPEITFVGADDEEITLRYESEKERFVAYGTNCLDLPETEASKTRFCTSHEAQVLAGLAEFADEYSLLEHLDIDQPDNGRLLVSKFQARLTIGKHEAPEDVAPLSPSDD